MNSTAGESALHILADPAALLPGHVPLRWDTKRTAPGELSAPRLVEAQFFRIREDFLRWIGDIPRRATPYGTLEAALSLPDGHSAWWHSRIVERFPTLFGNDLYELFKIRALEIFLDEHPVSSLVLTTEDERLRLTLEDLCRCKGLPFRCVDIGVSSSSDAWLANLKHALRNSRLWKFLRCLRYWLRWCCRTRRMFARRPPVRVVEGVVIGTWFPNHQRDAHGRYINAYVPALHPLLDASGLPVHWLLIYSKNDAELAAAVRERDALMAHDSRADMTFWQEAVTWKDACEALADWFRIATRWQSLKAQLPQFCRWEGCALSARHYLLDAWEESFEGLELLDYLLMRRGLRRYMAGLPRQRLLLTTSEMQVWERMLFSWATEHDLPAWAVQNTIIPECDFRNMFWPEATNDATVLHQLPTRFVCNSEHSCQLLMRGGFPAARLAVAETLRMQYLGELAQANRTPPARLAVLTGYDPPEAETQLLLLRNALQQLTDGHPFKEIVVKAHPFMPVKGLLADLGLDALGVRECSTPVQDILAWPDAVAFAANNSSVPLQALYAGMPLIVLGADNGFDLSLIGGHPGIPYVHTARELAENLVNPPTPPRGPDLLLLDKKLPRWRDILSAYAVERH